MMAALKSLGVIKYMIIGMPRSRTTWLANLFTTGNSICLHDPMGSYSIDSWDDLYPEKYVGISDTCLYLAGPKFINKLTPKKVIIHRRISDIRKSLGMKCIYKDMSEIDGLHVVFDEIDSRIEEIWNYCLNIPFDKDRYELLRDYNVQPHFDGMTPPNQEKINNFVGTVLI